MDTSLKVKALAITKALAYQENGGKVPNQGKPGQSGEMASIFQFTPGTWNLYSKQVVGKVLPMNPENESAVAFKKVSDWLGEGFNTEQIASMWNAGEGNPDAYKENHKGVNSKGVAYDTPAYAQKVVQYTSKFENELTGGSQGSQTQSAQEPTPPIQPQIQDNSAVSSPVDSQTPSQSPTQPPVPSKNPIKQNKTLPQMLQKQIKPI